MADNRKITIIKASEHATIERDKRACQREEKRRAELKKIKDELLTLAQRLARIEEEEAA